MLEAANPRELLGMEDGPNQKSRAPILSPKKDGPFETPSPHQDPVGPMGPQNLIWHSIWDIPD